ncbi:MAG: DUF2029 domain-containing protein [Clostridiales bacterium]|nr:DUF2029 domain-containing protein [Clostridiales bacterium]
MTKWERAALTHVKKHILRYGAAAVFLLSLWMRYSFWPLLNSDLVTMGSWVDAAREGGFRALLAKIDYSPAYAYLFFLLGQLPLPLTSFGLVKLMFVGFEYLCIGACVMLVYRLSDREERAGRAFAVFALLSLSPVMVLNAAAWGQCDAMYTLFVVLCVLMLVKNRPIPALLFYAVALCLKLQAVFVLPALLLYWLTQAKKSFLYLLVLPALVWLSGLPLAFFGEGPWAAFSTYGAQGGSQLFWVTKNYPGFYALLGSMLDPFAHTDYGYFYLFIRYGLGLCAAALVAPCALLVRRGARLEGRDLVLLFAWTALVCAFFLPYMHERYGMMGETLLLCWVALRKKPLYYGLWVASTVVTVFAYGNFLFEERIVPQQIGAFVNLGILMVLTAELLKPAEVPALVK